MNVMKVLNDFSEYINYDPDQKEFNLFSTNYYFHGIGKKIEDLLSGYDPTGVISVMFARQAFLKAAGDSRLSLKDYLTRKEVREDLERDEKMYKELTDPEILEAENIYMNQMNELVMQAMGKPMIGDRDMEAERETFSASVMDAVEDLRKCRIDVFKTAGPIGKLKKFTTRILVFEQMADCLLHIEAAPDALYFCYINQHGSADGYFSFLIKSEGNVISICDRIPESYIGQHGNMRNGRWAEDHADGIFPYDFIFAYSEHDYKGYATKYEIDDEKLDFMNLRPEVYQPILVAMILLRNKYEGKVIEGEPLYLTSMMKEYYLEEHPGADLMVLENNSIAVRNEAYYPELPLEQIMDGSLNERFDMNQVGDLWVDLYGKGFQPDYQNILSTTTQESLLTDKNKPEFYTEFIGTKDVMDREVYRRIRLQLARYIKKEMEKEYDAFGGKEKILDYWTEQIKGKKDILIDAFCQRQYYYDHPDEMSKEEGRENSSFSSVYTTKVSDIQSRITLHEKERPSGICLNDTEIYRGRYLENAYDDQTGHKCSIFFHLAFHNWNEMEALTGEPLPKIFTGYTKNGEIGYNGNSILQATDAVGNIVSPLYGGTRSSNEKKYDKCSFDVWLGFSKTGWKKIYENWLKKSGHADEIERMKQEKKEKEEEEKRKLSLPAKPYEPSNFVLTSTYENKDELIKIEKELDALFPGNRIGCISSTGEGTTASTVSAFVKEKGNKGKIEKLKDLGWYVERRYKRSGCFLVALSKCVPKREKN